MSFLSPIFLPTCLNSIYFEESKKPKVCITVYKTSNKSPNAIKIECLENKKDWVTNFIDSYKLLLDFALIR